MTGASASERTSTGPARLNDTTRGTPLPPLVLVVRGGCWCPNVNRPAFSAVILMKWSWNTLEAPFVKQRSVAAPFGGDTRPATLTTTCAGLSLG